MLQGSETVIANQVPYIFNSDKINESQDASLRVEMGNIKLNDEKSTRT